MLFELDNGLPWTGFVVGDGPADEHVKRGRRGVSELPDGCFGQGAGVHTVTDPEEVGSSAVRRRMARSSTRRGPLVLLAASLVLLSLSFLFQRYANVILAVAMGLLGIVVVVLRVFLPLSGSRNDASRGP